MRWLAPGGKMFSDEFWSQVAAAVLVVLLLAIWLLRIG